MIKNKIDYKLINVAIITLIVFLVYSVADLWGSIIDKILTIALPFFFAFAFAYALYPMLSYLESRNIRKGISIALILTLVISVLALLIGLVIPTMFGQTSSLFTAIIAFFTEISHRADLNIGPIQDALKNSFEQISLEMGKYVSNGAINLIGLSLGFISVIVITFASSIYFLMDMKDIRHDSKVYLSHKSSKLFHYVQLLDHEMKNYLTGFMKILVITFFEYSITFYIIGHPNALLLGFLAALANLIPYFGGIVTNIIAIITAFVVSPLLFWKTVIAFFVLSSVDGYVINPIVYGKTNKLHPIIVIMSVFTGGILFGIMGIVLSLPIAIIIIATLKYFKEDINVRLEDMKTNNRKRRTTKTNLD
jgi:predicted PurR-regulated permease PerM